MRGAPMTRKWEALLWRILTIRLYTRIVRLQVVANNLLVDLTIRHRGKLVLAYFDSESEPDDEPTD